MVVHHVTCVHILAFLTESGKCVVEATHLLDCLTARVCLLCWLSLTTVTRYSTRLLTSNISTGMWK